MYDMNLSVRYLVKETGQKTSEILDKIQRIQFIAPYKPKNLEIYKICKDSIGTFTKYLIFKKSLLTIFENSEIGLEISAVTFLPPLSTIKISKGEFEQPLFSLEPTKESYNFENQTYQASFNISYPQNLMSLGFDQINFENADLRLCS